MKKLLPLLLLAAATASCTRRPVISGRIEGLTNDTLIVQWGAIEAIPAKELHRDTVVVRKGRFTFDAQIKKPCFFSIRPLQAVIPIRGGYKWYSSVSDIHFTLDRGERVAIRAKVDSIYTDYTLSGESPNTEWSRFRAEQLPLHIAYTRLSLRADTVLSAEETNALSERLRALSGKIIGAVTEYIRENPCETLSGYLLADIPTDSVLSCFTLLDERVRTSRFAPLIAHAVGKGEARQRSLEARKKTAPGMPAPEFVLRDADGKEFALSSLRGRYVVLDFWGSWCGWCIKGFPRMKACYERYKDKLEIVGIACNDTPEKWREAIGRHGLPWVHVINPRNAAPGDDVTVRYAVEGYPTKIVIDPEGRIAARFVGESEEFYDKLAEMLE